MRVSLSYRVLPTDVLGFVARMKELRQVRLRDGAVDWVLERDLADSEQFVESFHVRSWQEHLRQHERLTQADLSLENEIRELGAGGGQPPVTHLVVPRSVGRTWSQRKLVPKMEAICGGGLIFPREGRVAHLQGIHVEAADGIRTHDLLHGKQTL